MKGLLLAMLIVLFPLSAATVLVHDSVPLDSLSQAQLRNIFTLRQTQWPDGTAVRVIVLPDSASSHQRFSREQLRLFPYQLNMIWDKHSFSGTGNRPLQVPDANAMLQQLRTVPGAIGYLEQFDADPTIKEVRIE